MAMGLGRMRGDKKISRFWVLPLQGFVVFVLSSLLMQANSAMAVEFTVERVSLFANHGSAVHEDRREPITSVSATAPTIEVLDFEKTIGSVGRVEWKWRLRNASSAPVSDLRLTAFIDIDLAASTNTYFNEAGLQTALTPPSGHIAADRWEIGEQGYWTGSLLSRAAVGDLRNATTAAVPGDDIAAALSAVPGVLEARQEVTAWLILDEEPSTGLQQKDTASAGAKSLHFYLLKGAVPPNTYGVDYAVTQTIAKPTVVVGDAVEYQIVLTNLGAVDGTGVTMTSTVPAQITGVEWTCRAEGAAACLTASGAGNGITVRGDVPHVPGSRLLIAVRGMAAEKAAVDHVVRVAPTHADTNDTNPHNDTSVVSLVIGQGVEPPPPPPLLQADLELRKTAATPAVSAGGKAVFHLAVFNHGPDSVSQARLTDAVPAGFQNVAWTCVPEGGGQCAAGSGAGSLIDLMLDLPAGASARVEVTGTLALNTASVSNTATVSSTVNDPDPSNNTSTARIDATVAAAAYSIPATGRGAVLLASACVVLLGWAGLAGRSGRTRFWRALPGLMLAWLALAHVDAHALFVNGDFETQNLDGWAKRSGYNPGLSGSPPFQVSDVRINAGGIEKVTLVGSQLDLRAPQLIFARQGNFSAKVNDHDNGAHLNEISQKASITEADRDPGDGKLHVRFSYAAVLEDPNHSANEQPYFFVELKDLTRGETLYYDFAFANQPGRVFYTTILGGAKWVSTPFIDVDLVVPDASLGHELHVRVVGADCSASGHGGYVYVDAFGAVSIPPQGACIHDLQVRSKPGNAQLTWNDTGAATYAIYRAEALEGPYLHMGTTQSRHSTWLDRTVQPWKTYYYRVHALDVDGHALCSSGEVATVVPAHWSVGDAVNRPPIFTSAPQRTGDVRAPYAYQAVAVDADGDTLAYRLLYAPVGMAVDAATGQITWQPGLAGDYRVNLQVSDGKGLLASQAFAIHVVDGNLPPAITSKFPAKVPAGVNYSHQVQATDPEKERLQYTLGSQAVGLTINESGAITWTNPQPGTYPITIQVTDPHGARDVQQLVVAVQAFPEFTSLPVVTATASQPYTYQAQAIDKDGDPISYSVLSGPAGLAVDTATGQVTWPSPVTGNAAVTLAATDPDGNQGKQSFTIRVTATPNRVPVFTATPVIYVAYPAAYAYTASASDADGDNLLWELLQAPAGMTLNERTGAIAWKFSHQVNGKFRVRVQVSDQRGGLAKQNFELQVPVYGNGGPSITSRPASQVRAGQAYTYAVSATDPENEPLVYRLAQGPASATWNGAQLSWQTSTSDIGVHELAIEVADPSGNTALQSWQLEVVPASANQPPVISSTPRVTAVAGALYEYQVIASDRDGDPLAYALASAPAGMVISATGKVEWTVPAGMAGTEAVEILVSDGRGGEAVQAYAIGIGITANRPPLINSTPVATATAGATYRYQLLASDPDGDTLHYTVSTQEPGIAIDAATGLLAWPVPAGAAGQAGLTVQVTDGKGGVASQTYAIGVGAQGNRPPRVTTQPGTTGTSGSAYTYALRASDADGDTLTYTLLEYPQGMTIASATGDIQWAIPANVAGMAPVMVEVADGKGGLATQGYAISVSGASNRAPAFSSTPPTMATAGAAYAYTVRATDPDGDAITYTLATAPAGMALHAQTGAITWTPTLQQGGEQAVAVRATDAKGAYATQSFKVYVQLPGNNPPQITSKPVMRWAPGVPYQYQVSATDPDRDAITYALTLAPAGMGIQAATGLLTWNAPTLGTHTVEIKAQDPRGAYAVQRYTLQIAANREPVITSVPQATATVGAPYAYQVSATDPDGDFLTYRMAGAPAALTISATGLISGTPTAQGTHAVTVTVSDGQASATQSWTLRITEPAVGGPLQAGVQPQPKYIDLGESTLLQVFAEGGTPPYSVSSLTVNGRSVAVNASYQATYTATGLGKHNVRLILRDAKNASVTVDDWFSVKDPADTQAPQALISAPGSSDDITVSSVSAPADIVGTASDASLAEYVLLLSPAGKDQWSRLGGGTTSVTNGKLGELNPQTLANGLYDIGLIVRDTSGHETSARITVAIEGEQKTAPLQLTFTDLSLDVEGLPLTVRRSYDSLKRTQRLDFGHGWTVDYQDIWLQTNGVPGRAWELKQTGSGLGQKMCAMPQGTRMASVRLPGGQLEQFELRASPECVSTLQWMSNPTVSIAFTPKASNKSGSTLEALNHGELRMVNNVLFDMDALDAFDPAQYRLTLRDGTQYTLDKDFGIQQIRDRQGNTLQFTRNGISHSGGWALSFTRDAAGKITRITGPGGQSLLYGYDAADNLTSMTDPSGAASDYRYENPKVPHGLTSYTDPLGRLLLKTTYDDAGRITSQTDALGRAITVNTDNTAQRQTIKDRNGNTTTYAFDGRGNITQVTNALGGVTRYAYDAQDNETEVTDPLGRTTTRTYDAYGNVTSETDPLGRQSATAYNAQGNVTTMTDPAGHVTTNTYDGSGQLTRITDAAGQAIALGYASDGSLGSIADKAGHATRYQYAKINGTTLKQSETAPDGTVTTYAYDSAGRVTGSTRAIVTVAGQPASAVVETTAYDANGNATSRTNAAGATTTYQYDAAGQLTQETDSQGRKTTHEYTARGEKAKTTYPDGRADTWAYDNNGNETQSCESGLCTRTAYDALDRPVKVTDPGNYAVESIYDAAGQLTASKDARGHSTTFAYDLAGRETRQTNAAGIATTKEYDLAGNLVKTTDGLGQATTHTYDGTNKRTSTTLPTGATTRYHYNANGVLQQETNPLGHAHQYAYDSLGALQGVTDPLGQATTYTWNGQNQLLTQTDANGHTTGYGYDLAGQRVSRTLPSGHRETLAYDSEGRLATRTAFDGSQTSYQYDAGGKLTKTTRSDGHTLTQGYDGYGRISTQTDSAYGSLSLNLDANGRITREYWSHQTLGTGLSPVLDYAWGGNGNRLAKVTTGAKTIEYGYDTSGRRIKRLVKEGATATETHYRIDHQRAYSEIVIESTKVNNGAWVDTVHVHTPDGAGELIASSGSGSATQYFADGLGSVRVAQDAAQRHAYSYDAFGVELGSDEGMPANDAAAHAVSHRYTGEYTDRHTGLIYLRARD